MDYHLKSSMIETNTELMTYYKKYVNSSLLPGHYVYASDNVDVMVVEWYDIHPWSSPTDLPSLQAAGGKEHFPAMWEAAGRAAWPCEMKNPRPCQEHIAACDFRLLITEIIFPAKSK